MRSLVRLTVALLAFTAILTTSAAAHVSEDHFGWFWRLGTTNLNDDNKVLDPLNLVWVHGLDYQVMDAPGVEDEVETEWRGRPSHGQMNHGQICLGQPSIAHIIGDGRQNAWFRSDTQPSQGPRKVATEFQESTSNKCNTQYHMRFWTDKTHSEITNGHGDFGQWSISGVHRDIAQCSFAGFGSCHEISKRWDGYRNYAVNRAMRSMCGRSRWRMYPGGDRDFQGHRFDGYIATIRGTKDSTGCPNGLY